MAEIRWTDEAIKWLYDIHSYISDNNPEAAERVIDDLYNKVQLLKDYPNVGYCYRKLSYGEIRILLHGHYRIGYLIKNNECIDILGVFHNAMDIDKYLFKSGHK